MNREEKNALSRRKILDAALREFSEKGYDGASLNAVCARNKISKGLIYHYFKDKDELYLQCAAECFTEMTAFLTLKMNTFSGSEEEKIKAYFDARLRFFAENPLYLGIFTEVSYHVPASLSVEIESCRRDFDRLNYTVLTELLNGKTLRAGLTSHEIIEDFRLYMNYFNLQFDAEIKKNGVGEETLKEHEKRCRRQLDVLLYGVLGEK